MPTTPPGLSADAVVALVRSLLPGGGRVLDAGCGTGGTTVALADAGYVAIGLDKDLEAIRPVADAHPRIPFWLDDLTDLDLPMALVGRGFDLVLLVDVVGTMGLADLDATFTTCTRLVADDGRLLVTVPAGSVGTASRSAEKAGWAQQSRTGLDGGTPAGGADVVLVLGRAPQKAPSRLRTLLRR